MASVSATSQSSKKIQDKLLQPVLVAKAQNKTNASESFIAKAKDSSDLSMVSRESAGSASRLSLTNISSNSYKH
jgi:hypothetical protein